MALSFFVLLFLFHFVFLFYPSYLNYNHTPHVAFTVVSSVSLSRTGALPSIFLIPFTVVTFLKSPGRLFCTVSHSGCLILSEEAPSTLAEHCAGGIASGTCLTVEGWHPTAFSLRGLARSETVSWEVTLRCRECPFTRGCSVLQWSLPYQLPQWWLRSGDFLKLCIQSPESQCQL